MVYKNPIRVIIADTQYLVVTSLKTIIECENQYLVSSIVSNKNDLLKALKTEFASVVIVDFTQIDFNSLVDLKIIRQEYPCLTILVLTNLISKNEVVELKNIGINNIIYKTADKDEIFSALKATIQGKKFYSEDILEMLFDIDEIKNVNNETEIQLTCSEIEIVRLISNGYTTKEIALRKHISFHTVMSHRKNIFRKLSINSSSELLMHAIKTGMISVIEYHI